MSATAWAFVAFLSGCAWVALACLWPDLAKIALGAILAARCPESLRPWPRNGRNS